MPDETPEAAMSPEDVSGELVHAFKRAELMAALDEADPVRAFIARFLPATYKHWFAQAFGTPEEIAAREAEARSKPKDDPIELCERIRPGGHEQRVRAKVAEEASAYAEGHLPVVRALLYAFSSRITTGDEDAGAPPCTCLTTTQHAVNCRYRFWKLSRGERP